MGKMSTLAIVTVIALATVGAAMAVVILSGTVNITPQTATLTLTANSTTPIVGEHVLLTATLNPVMSGKTVTFTNGATTLGTDTTDASGVASLIIAVPSSAVISAQASVIL